MAVPRQSNVQLLPPARVRGSELGGRQTSAVAASPAPPQPNPHPPSGLQVTENEVRPHSQLQALLVRAARAAGQVLGLGFMVIYSAPNTDALQPAPATDWGRARQREGRTDPQESGERLPHSPSALRAWKGASMVAGAGLSPRQPSSLGWPGPLARGSWDQLWLMSAPTQTFWARGARTCRWTWPHPPQACSCR